MPPKKRDIPGYDPVSDDDKAKGEKRSRRKPKATTTDEAIQAGPSSAVPSPSPAQTGYGPGPSIQNPPTSTEKVQTPAPIGARQSIQIPSRPAQTATSLTQPAQSVAPIGTLQAGQATSLNKPTDTAGPTARLPNRDVTGSDSLKEGVSAGIQPGKEMTSSGGGKQEVARLKGQPRRPEKRPQVNKVDLVSNYFTLKLRPNLVLWHYGIIVEPEIKGPKLTQIIKTALNYGGYRELRPLIVTDFSAVMLSAEEIPAEYRKFKMSYQSELETQPANNAKEYWISLVEKGFVDLREPKSYLSSIETSSNGLPIEQALDIVLGHHRKLSDDVAIVNKRKAFSINSNLPNAYDDYNLGLQVLIALRGYFSSVRLSQSSILVNINVSHGAFYKANLPLMDVINGLTTGLGVDPSKIPGVLRGLRVSSSHIPRVWSIWGFPRKGDGKGYMLHPPRLNPLDATSYTPKQVSFFHEENAQALSEGDKKKAKDGRLPAHDDRCSCPGRWMTVAEYFETVRMEPISVENLKLHVVNVGSSKRPTYLPSHLCKVRRGQISNLKLNSDQSRGMINFAVRNPDENATSISNKAFNALGLTSANPELERFGISVSRSMVRLKGRTLTQPVLLYGDQKVANLRGSHWSLLGFPFRNPKELKNWACLRIISRPQKDKSIHEEPLRNCLTDFQTHLKSKGIIAEGTNNHDDLQIRGNNFESLEEWFRESRDTYRVRFLLVVLPDRPTSELYNHIKRYGDLKYGIHTVCVKTKNFGTLPYDDNVALKVNLKLGGKNHVLDEKSYGSVFKDPTMVVGIDVTHPAPGNDGAPSVAAVVASCDRELTQWPADLRINNSRQEMVEMLREMLKTRIEVFQKHTRGHLLPKNIIIYRDGVGEGQYKIVLDEELPRLRRACQDVYKTEYQEGIFPRISLIVVGKRHHTRFYATSTDGTVIPGKNSNPGPGTLVDEVITQNCNWDFFLQSHTAIKGTARPAHYFVLVDEIFRRISLASAVRDLEVFTHNLCYLYGKATTSVSIPPPVYYADKACDRGRRYLSRVFDPSQRRGTAPVRDDDVKVNEYLKDTMFYI